MGHDQVVSSNERNFIVGALHDSDVRIDGRSSKDLRAVRITLGAQTGVAEVQYGQTRVLAAVTGDIVQPMDGRGNEGLLNFFCDFSPMASPYFEAGRASDHSIELARVIERGIRDSKAVDMESLCVVADQKVWSLRCDIRILDHNGNLTDCANLAAVTALQYYRRPDVTVLGTTVTIHSVDDRQPVALAMHHIPIAVSFAFLATEESRRPGSRVDPTAIVDPSLKEENVCDSYVTVTCNQFREVCCIQKPGGVSMSPALLLQCAQIATLKAVSLSERVTATIADWQTKRDQRGSKSIVRRVGGPREGDDGAVSSVGSTATLEKSIDEDEE